MLERGREYRKRYERERVGNGGGEEGRERDDGRGCIPAVDAERCVFTRARTAS